MNNQLIRVAMVILHQNDEFLLQHRSDDPNVYASGMWGVFGGHVESGEEPEEAAKREIEEELGLRLEGPLELLVHRIDKGRERFFYAAPLPVPISELVLHEGQGMDLVPYTSLGAYEVIPIHREAIDALYRRIHPE